MSTSRRQCRRSRTPPAVFRSLPPQRFQRWGLLIALSPSVVYLAFCFSFFTHPTFVDAQWDRAGDLSPGLVFMAARSPACASRTATSSRNGRLAAGNIRGPIDWLKPTNNGGYTVIFGGDDRLDVTPSHVTSISMASLIPSRSKRDRAIRLPGRRRGWCRRNRSMSDFGFAGQAEIREAGLGAAAFPRLGEFRLRHQSPFWGQSPAWCGLMLFGERLDPSKSNASLAFDNFLNNGTGSMATLPS